MKPRRIIIIDAQEKILHEATVTDLKDMQKIVGGYICLACSLPNGDEIYVNDEGLLSDPKFFFYPEGAHQPFALNGFIIGGPDSEGELTDAKIKLEEAKAMIEFYGINDVIGLKPWPLDVVR